MTQHRAAENRPRKAWIAVALLGAIVLGLLGVWILGPRMLAKEYARFTSPDGNYEIVVFREPVWPAVMPGQAGDAPGTVRLYDQHGKLLRQARVEMVQLVNEVEWTDDSVRIKLIAEWELPH